MKDEIKGASSRIAVKLLILHILWTIIH